MPSRKSKKVLGIDSSTTGVAWTLVEKGIPVKWGKINTSKDKTMQSRLEHINADFPALLTELKPDWVYIEKSIYMRNVVTMRVLSYIIGALMSHTLMKGIPITDIEPMVAKSNYNYSPLTRRFTQAAKAKLGALEAKKLAEGLRKSQIQRVNTYNFPGFDASDHDISDSCSIAIYGYEQLVKKLDIKATKEIRLDLEALSKLGLDEYI